MANELTGVTGVRGAPIPPGAPVRPAEPSRAIVPARPTDPADTASPRQDSPLGRSGLSALDLLLTSDLVVARDAVAPVALEAGLETARGALLRQQPGEALAALDEIWARAALSEEGWYLRAGALTMLGQAEEGDRVAGEGLFRAPTSVALRFLQSVARVIRGDFAAARAALLPALDLRPEHPVLLAHHVLLQARQGRIAETEPQLRQLAAAFPDHPAVRWAQGEFRAIRAGFTRTASRATPFAEVGQVMAPPLEGAPTEVPTPESTRTPPDTAAIDGAAAASSDLPSGAADGDAAFARLGVRLGIAGSADVVADARTLLRAFSSGGALAGGVLADQAHGARTVLAAMISTLKGETRAAGPAVIPQLVTALRDGRVSDIARTIRRDARVLPFPQRRWIDALLSEVLPGSASRAARSASPGDDIGRDGAVRDGAVLDGAVRAGDYETVLHQAREDGPELPVRLGLSLLTDSPAARLAVRTPDDGVPTVWHDRRTPSDLAAADDVTPSRALAALGVTAPPRAPADAPTPLDVGVILPPVLALAVAAAAGLNGASFVAGVAVAAAAWLAFRRRPAVTPDERDRID